MLSIPRVLYAAETYIRYTLVQLVGNLDAEIAELFVFAVQGIFDDFIGSLGVESADAQYLIVGPHGILPQLSGTHVVVAMRRHEAPAGARAGRAQPPAHPVGRDPLIRAVVIAADTTTRSFRSRHTVP